MVDKKLTELAIAEDLSPDDLIYVVDNFGPEPVSRQTTVGGLAIGLDVKTLQGFSGDPLEALRGDGQFGPAGDVYGPLTAVQGNLIAFGTTSGKSITDTGARLTDLVFQTDPRLTDARSPILHAPTHLDGGSDPLDIKTLSGFSGIQTEVLRGDKTFGPIIAIPGAHQATHQPGGTDELQNNAWTNRANTFTAKQLITTTDNSQLQVKGQHPAIELVDARLAVNQKMGRLTYEGSQLRLNFVNDTLDALVGPQVLLANEGRDYLRLYGLRPEIHLEDSAAPGDKKLWRIINSGEHLVFYATNDAITANDAAFLFMRNGDLHVGPEKQWANAITINGQLSNAVAPTYIQAGEPGVHAQHTILSNNYRLNDGGSSGRQNTSLGAAFIRLSSAGNGGLEFITMSTAGDYIFHALMRDGITNIANIVNIGGNSTTSPGRPWIRGNGDFLVANAPGGLYLNNDTPSAVIDLAGVFMITGDRGTNPGKAWMRGNSLGHLVINAPVAGILYLNLDSQAGLEIYGSHTNMRSPLTCHSTVNLKSTITIDGTQLLQWGVGGVAPPSVGTRSAGTKIVFYPDLSPTSVDYAIGMESGALWYSVPVSGNYHKWYNGTTLQMWLGSNTLNVLGRTYLQGGFQSANPENYITAGQWVRLHFRDQSQTTGNQNFSLFNYQGRMRIVATNDDGSSPIYGDWDRSLTVGRDGETTIGSGGLKVYRIINGTGLGAGAWTPTDAGSMQNVSLAIYGESYWSQVGKIVTVSGKVDVWNQGLGSTCWLRMYLPTYSLSTILSGNTSGVSAGKGVVTTSTDGETGFVNVPGNSGHADISFTPTFTGTRAVHFTFSYLTV